MRPLPSPVRPVLAGVVFLLAGCATAPSEVLAPGSFAIVGRVAVRYGTEAATGRITWRHTDATDELLISSPLGQGVAEITRRDGVYTLLSSTGERYSAADPERLTQQVLGYALPLGGLPDWLQARPESGAEAAARYDGERLAELRQRGWLIEYSSYDDAARLPKRMQLTRGDLDIRIVIDEWQLPPR